MRIFHGYANNKRIQEGNPCCVTMKGGHLAKFLKFPPANHAILCASLATNSGGLAGPTSSELPEFQISMNKAYSITNKI